MSHIAVLGAGITGITTAYALLKRGFSVTIFDRHRYPAMETSYANGGQLSASNAEVWNNFATMKKGMQWLFKKDAPLQLNLKPSWHKYSWFAQFVAATRHYKENTQETVRLALLAREKLFEIAREENIDFDLEKRGILHFYDTRESFDKAASVNAILTEAGLHRVPISPDEIKQLEPALHGDFAGGFFTEHDATGDIHKFTRGLAARCIAMGATLELRSDVQSVQENSGQITVTWVNSEAETTGASAQHQDATFDGIVVCAGVKSPYFAKQLGDTVSIYPVKGYSITVDVPDDAARDVAPWVSLLDESAKIVTSRLGKNRYRVAGTAEFNGFNRDIRHDRVQPLINWVEKHHPSLNTSRCIPWAGLRPMAPNMMPRVGCGNNAGVFYNTGHGHLGWTLSAATAEIVATQIDDSFSNRHAA